MTEPEPNQAPRQELPHWKRSLRGQVADRLAPDQAYLSCDLRAHQSRSHCCSQEELRDSQEVLMLYDPGLLGTGSSHSSDM